MEIGRAEVLAKYDPRGKSRYSTVKLFDRGELKQILFVDVPMDQANICKTEDYVSINITKMAPWGKGDKIGINLRGDLKVLEEI